MNTLQADGLTRYGIVCVLVVTLLAGCAVQTKTVTIARGAHSSARDVNLVDAMGMRRNVTGKDRAWPWYPRPDSSKAASGRALAAASIPIETGLGDWRQVGPLDWPGKVMEIAVSSQSEDVVFAAYGLGGVWKTEDGGANWLRLTPRHNSALTWGSVAVSAADARTVAIGSGHGDFSYGSERRAVVYKSMDGGQSWRDITPPMLGTRAVVRIVMSATSARRMYVLTTAGVFRTDDDGQNWRSSFTFSPAADYWDDLPDLAVNPNNFEQAVFVHPNDGVQFTNNGGAAWTAANMPGMAIAPGVVSWSASATGLVYVQTRPKGDDPTVFVWRSRDSGANFALANRLTEFNQGRYDLSLAIHPRNENVLAIGNSYYHFSSDALATYTSEYCCSRVDLMSVAFAPSNPNVVYAGTDQGVYKMSDGGRKLQNATRFDAGVASQHTFALAVSSLNGSRILFANAGDYPTFRGDITSGTTSFVGGPAYEYTEVAVAPNDPNLVFTAGGGDALRRSLDRGLTWSDVEFLDPVSREYRAPIEFFGPTSDTVFIADKQVYKSTKKGAAGSFAAIGPPSSLSGNVNLRLMRVAPSDANAIYASGAWGTTELLLTRDGGLNWAKVDVGVHYQQDIAIDPADASKAIVSGPFDMKSCSNFLQSCTALNKPTGVVLRRVVFDPKVPGRVFAGAELGGVLVSVDSGRNWRRLGKNLSSAGITDLKLQDGRLYAANNEGVFELRQDNYGQAAKPSGLALQQGALRWTSTTGAQTYRVFRDSQEVWRGTALQFQDLTLPLGQTGCYQVVGENAQGQGAWSEPLCGQDPRTADQRIDDCLFSRMERTYSQLLAPSPAESLTANPFRYRYYAGTQSYLGTSASDRHLYYVGPYSSNQLLDVGLVSQWLPSGLCY
jgi:photosystem II stability/assembly factor-like uncharacterized protein